MRSPLPARSPNSAGSLLIAAISGRALAAAARRAGYRPLVADFFCDTDTVALAERAVMLPGDLQHGIDGERAGRDAAATGRKRAARSRVVLGSGFERRPELVDEIARHFPLAGNGGSCDPPGQGPADRLRPTAPRSASRIRHFAGSRRRSRELGGQDGRRRRRRACQRGEWRGG